MPSSVASRPWYHPFEILQNRYVVRGILFILEIIPASVYLQSNVVMWQNSNTPIDSRNWEVIIKTLTAVFIIDMAKNILFFVFYCCYSAKESYTVKIGRSQINGLKAEIITDILFCILLGLLGSLGIVFSTCRKYSLDTTLSPWCAPRSTALAFAIIAAAFYIPVIVLDILTTRKVKSANTNVELTPTSKAGPTAAPEQNEPPKQRWPPE